MTDAVLHEGYDESKKREGVKGMASRLEKYMAWLWRQYSCHKGKWLTTEAAEDYYKRAQQLPNTDGQLIGERRVLWQELKDEYGLTDLEAVNILNGYYISDYVNKYYRIKNQIPLDFRDAKKSVAEEDE